MNKTEINYRIYTADNPINSVAEDAFQRYGFAKRIAETITNRINKESIVFGIFGSWGEGKTSLLNFIKSEVRNQGRETIQITFNPWRFIDEATLLTSFFNTLASEIQKSVPEVYESESKGFAKFRMILKEIISSKKEPLKTSSENIGDLFQKYGKIAAIIGAGDITETIGKAMSSIDLEVLKTRIEKLLEGNNKRIIIYLDDIDRLDKSEIHSIFRLVKLTGDFSFITYVLSFDQDMVACAIGDKFGSGDKIAGQIFLEKIIQVPLNIPKAQPDSLKKFCFKFVDDILSIHDISLKEEEVKRFVYQFSQNICPALITPRQAVRYANTLSFIMPFMKEEVNMVDLMLIEALKVFYPDYYSLVKENSKYFIDAYYNSSNSNQNNPKRDEIQKQLDALKNMNSNYSNENVINLLKHLFPLFESAFINYLPSPASCNKWYENKRIASTKYFDRYFSYSVIDGDISDIEFKGFVDEIISGKTVDYITQIMQDILQKAQAENLLLKINAHAKLLSWEQTKVLIKAICNSSELLPIDGGIMNFTLGSPFDEACMFIYDRFINYKRSEDESTLFQFAQELMIFPKQFRFAYGINIWLRTGSNEENRLFTDKQYLKLSQSLRKRAVDEAADKSIFEVFPDQVHFLVQNWFELDKNTLNEYAKDYLDRHPQNVINVIKSFIPTIRSTARINPYKGDMTKERYDFMITFFDKKILYDKILYLSTLNNQETESLYWSESNNNDNTDINMLKQFLHWFSKENKI